MPWNGTPDHILHSGHHLLDGMAFASTEIQGQGCSPVHQVLLAEHMCDRQVVDVDVVSDAGAVRCRIVGAEDLQFRTCSSRRCQSQGNHVRLRIVQFADFATLVGTRGIEISQPDGPQAIGAFVSFQSILKEELGDPIGVDRLARCILRNGDLRGHAINGTARRKHKKGEHRHQLSR